MEQSRSSFFQLSTKFSSSSTFLLLLSLTRRTSPIQSPPKLSDWNGPTATAPCYSPTVEEIEDNDTPVPLTPHK